MADAVENLHHQPPAGAARDAAVVHGGRDAAVVHGGNLDAARAAYPEAPQPWIDLSTGINPWPYPLPPLPVECWSRLPPGADAAALHRAAASCYGAPSPRHLLAVPGTQAAIQQLPRLRPPGVVAVVGPTYGEHARGWAAAGHRVTEVPDLDRALAQNPPPAVVVVVNPNNPDGRRQSPDTLLQAADTLARTGGWLVVDEAFADADPRDTVASATDRPGLIVLRSFGKFFGLAGLRLGFVLAEPALCARLADHFGPWAVSGPALVVGAAALGDSSWIRATRARINDQTARLHTVLDVKGVDIVGGCPLFTLVSVERAGTLFDHLARSGIWSRPFHRPQNWLRLGLPADEAALRRLKKAMKLYGNSV